MKLDGHEGALWARVALLASEAKTALLEKAGLIDPSAFRLPRDESGKLAERLPSAAEIQKWLEGVRVAPEELLSEAEREYMGAIGYGDGALAERLRRVNGSGNGPDDERGNDLEQLALRSRNGDGAD